MIGSVEDVEAELQPAGLTQTELAGNGQIGALKEAAAQVVGTGLEPDATHGRSGESSRVELPVDVGGAAGARIAQDANATTVVGRAGDVLIAAAALVGGPYRVSAPGGGRPNAREAPVVGDLLQQAGAGLGAGDFPHEVAFEGMAIRDEVTE